MQARLQVWKQVLLYVVSHCTYPLLAEHIFNIDIFVGCLFLYVFYF